MSELLIVSPAVLGFAMVSERASKLPSSAPMVFTTTGLVAVRSNSAITSPSAVRLIWANMYEVDVRSAIEFQTTIVLLTGDCVVPIGGGRYLAEHIPGAQAIGPGATYSMAQAAPSNVQQLCIRR